MAIHNVIRRRVEGLSPFQDGKTSADWTTPAEVVAGVTGQTAVVGPIVVTSAIVNTFKLYDDAGDITPLMVVATGTTVIPFTLKASAKAKAITGVAGASGTLSLAFHAHYE